MKNDEEIEFNSPFEVGLRALIILSVSSPRSFDLQRLIYYDYLILHTNDVSTDNSPKSLHPATPHRSGELIVRRKGMQEGLNLMYSKTLIEIVYSENGIFYVASDLSAAFLELFESSYYRLLQKNAEWIASYFSTYSDEAIRKYIEDRLGTWGGEFIYEAFLRE